MQAVSEFARIGSSPLRPYVEEAALVQANEPVSKIIGTMASKSVYEVFVDGNAGIELITLRSILRARGVAGRKASTLTTKPRALKIDDSVSTAAAEMSQLRVRSLPVTDQRGRLVGQVSATRLLEDVSRLGPGSLKAMDIMTPHPVTINSDSSLDRARDMMIERDIDHLPIAKNGGLAGMITSQDLVMHLLPAERASKGSMLPETMRRGASEVGGLRPSPPVTCNPSDPALRVLRTVLDQRKTAALVTLVEEIQGIVTLRDYTRLFVVSPSDQVPVYLVGLPDEPSEAAMAEMKFKRTVEGLRKVYPEITEARATIKKSSPLGERKRFEVDVLVRMPGNRIGFTEEAWSLAEAFDGITTKLKRLMTKPEKKPSYRRFPTRAERSSSAPSS